MRAGLALFLTLTLLTLAPFAAALEIQHELAAADHDGQEHSDTDLCQWLRLEESLDKVRSLNPLDLAWQRRELLSSKSYGR